MTPPTPTAGSQLQGRITMLKAVHRLMAEPIRVERLALHLHVQHRPLYRTLARLRETGLLHSAKSYYWLDLNQTPNPQPMPKAKGKEIQRRVATIYAVSYLASRPYKATELAKVLGVNIRTTYRILNDLRASNWLVQEGTQYSIQPNKTQTQNP